MSYHSWLSPFVVVAAAEGAKAAVTINKELQKEMRKEKVPELAA